MAEFSRIDAKAFRAGARRDPTPRAVAARYADGRIVIELDSGLALAFDPQRAHGLEQAAPADLAQIAIAGPGTALHFPKLDAYFSIAKLVEGFLGPMDWSRREARAAASRANGALGGRPKKQLASA